MPIHSVPPTIPEVDSEESSAHQTSAPEFIRIRIASGFPSLDFFVTEEMHALAARIAARNACLCFIGLLRDGTQILSTDREDLLERGCDRIAWIARDGSAA